MSENSPWAGDNNFQDSAITFVAPSHGTGWSITKTDGRSFWVSPTSPVEPKVDMSVRMYGNGIGSVVRGLFLDGQCVFYRTEAEQKEHAAIEAYGKDAADLLSRWDAGRGVWSIACGGFGPGYEQALQVAAFEVLRHLVNGGDIEKAGDILPSLDYLGLSGAQWGAARSLANRLFVDGPRKVHETYDRDRHIQISKNFPSPLVADLLDACKRALALLEPFDDPGLSLGLGSEALPPLRAAIAKAEGRS